MRNSLRQAASRMGWGGSPPPSPNNNMSGTVSPASPMGAGAQSDNPLFRDQDMLARMAAPSAGSAHSAQFSNQGASASPLARAASPSPGSGRSAQFTNQGAPSPNLGYGGPPSNQYSNQGQPSPNMGYASPNAGLPPSAHPNLRNPNAGLPPSAHPNLRNPGSATYSNQGSYSNQGGSGMYSNQGSSTPNMNGMNPVMQREMGGAQSTPYVPPVGLPPQWGAAAMKLADEDPMPQSMTLMERGSSFVNKLGSGTKHLAENPRDIYLIPARRIRETTWSTPRRKAITSFIMLFIFVLMCYLVARLVDTLKILNSQPYINEVRVTDLCSETFVVSFVGKVYNPSGTSATVEPMQSALYFGNKTIDPTGGRLMGYIQTPAFTIRSGNESLAIQITIVIPDNSSEHAVKDALETWLNGAALPMYVKIPLTASFPPDVFIFPVQFSTDLEFSFALPPSNQEYETVHPGWHRVLPKEYEPPKIEEIEIQESLIPTENILARVGLRIFNKKNMEKKWVELTLPPLTFDVLTDGALTASGITEFIHYGRDPPPEVLLENYGLVRAKGAFRRENAPGLWSTVRKLRSYEPITLTLVARTQNATDYTSYRPYGQLCRAQEIIEGMKIVKVLKTYEYESAKPVLRPGNRTIESGASMFSPKGVSITDINAQAVITTAIDVDVQGFMDWQNIRGKIPPINMVIDIDNQYGTSRTPLIKGGLPFGAQLNYSAPVIMNVPLTVQLMSATQLLRVIDIYVQKSNDVFFYIHGDNTTTLAGYLLSEVYIDTSIKQLLNELPPTMAPTRKSHAPTTAVPTTVSPTAHGGRRLVDNGGSSSVMVYDDEQEADFQHRDLAGNPLQDDAWKGKSISVDVGSDSYSFFGDLRATGFDTKFLGGIHVSWKEFVYQLSAHPPALSLQWEKIITLDMTAYDSDALNPQVELNVRFQDASFGNTIIPIVEDMTNYIPVDFNGQAKYANGPWFGAPFRFQMTQDTQNLTNTGQGVGLSILQFYHVEINSLIASQFSVGAFFGLDLGNLKINITLPILAIALGPCQDSSFLYFVMNPWRFATGLNSTEVIFLVEFIGASKVLTAIQNYVKGDTQNFCVKPYDAFEYNNFLSFLITRLGLNFNLQGAAKSPTTATVTSKVDVFYLNVSSTQTQVCTSIELNDTSLSTDTGTSFGWPDIIMDLNYQYNNQFTDIMRLNIDNGWFGPLSEFSVEQYNAPTVRKSITLSACIQADLNYNLNTSVAAVQTAVQTFYDGSAPIYIKLTGNTTHRISHTVSVLSGDFTAPANALSSFLSLRDQGVFDPLVTVKTNWGELEVIYLDAFNGDTFYLTVTVQVGNLGLLLITPPIQVRVSRELVAWNGPYEQPLFHVTAAAPPFGNQDAQPLNVTGSIALIAPQTWGETLGTLNDIMSAGTVIRIWYSMDWTQNLLSRIIPLIKFTVSAGDISSTAAPSSAPEKLDVTLSASSSDTVLTLHANILMLVRSSFAFVFDDLQVTVYDGNPSTADNVGYLTVKGTRIQEIGSGLTNLTVQMYGVADQFAAVMFSGSDTPIGFSGTVGSSVFRSYFSIPASITDSIALGASTKSTATANSISITDVAILGGDNVGTGGVLPCLVAKYCTDTIRTDSQVTYSGITGGITLQFAFPPLKGNMKLFVTLESDLFAQVQSNGFDIGRAVVRAPLSVTSSDTELKIVWSFLPDTTTLDETRQTINLVSNGEDTVFSVSGSQVDNYLSKVLRGLKQDLALVNIAPTDPNAPKTFGTLDLKLYSTTRNVLKVNAAMPVTYNPKSLVLSVGSLHVDIYFFHTKTGSVFNLDGYKVAFADTLAPMVISPNPQAQTLTVRAALTYAGPPGTNAQLAVDTLLSSFIWSLEMPLEIWVTLTPPPGNNYNSVAPFTFTTYYTIPKGIAISGFIDSINVDVAGTITSTLTAANVIVQATLVFRNTMTFPMGVSYYQYDIRLADPDGVATGGCNGISGGLHNNINPCAYISGWCYPPYSVPTSIQEGSNGAEIIKAFTGPIYPVKSILAGIDAMTPNGTGSTGLTINVDLERAIRLVDEMMIKNMMCGAVEQGLLVAYFKANPNTCSDTGTTLEGDLTCSFVAHIYFNLGEYALSNLDTCGTRMIVSDSTPFTYYKEGLYQFDQRAPQYSGVDSALGPSRTLVSSTQSSAGRSDVYQGLSLIDSFEIRFDLTVASGCGTGGSGEAIAINFLDSRPYSYTGPFPSFKGCAFSTGCWPALYAINGLWPGNFASVTFASYGCNAIGVSINGDTSSTLGGDTVKGFGRVSQSCAGGRLSNGNAHHVRISYNAFDHRARVFLSGDGSEADGYWDFDLNLRAIVGVDVGFIGFSADTGYWTCSTMQFSNLEHYGPRTDGLQTIVEGAVSLPEVSQWGSLHFHARDSSGRYRGRGGNTWNAQILDSVTGLVGNWQANNPQWYDRGDGTYYLYYKINVRGRFDIYISCNVGPDPNNCDNPSNGNAGTDPTWVKVASVFIRT